jgi:hypothetical protein
MVDSGKRQSAGVARAHGGERGRGQERALALSLKNPQACFQVRYHVNANGRTEVRWEALDGNLIEIVGDDRHRA